MRVGRNIEVLRLAPKQEIAHASAGEVGLIAFARKRSTMCSAASRLVITPLVWNM